ncbi:MAG: phage major capsid protein [Streptococcus orisratti]|nr:phage major capsid protein [Streptococcus orisratti]
MVIDLKKTPKYVEAMNELAAELSKGASVERQEELFANAFTTLGNELNDMAQDQLKNLFDERNANATLSANEIEFFNEVAKPEDNPGVKTEKIIPEEIMIRVFDDLKVEHPLLSHINFKNTGVNMKALIADTDGLAMWGEIYGEIKGQLKQNFDTIDFGMNKLTAFVVLPKDALKFSYTWLKQFIVEQIKEAMSVALELAIVKGNGDNQPVGLIKDISKPQADSGGKKITYPTDKTVTANLSKIDAKNAPELLAPLMEYLAVNDKGRFQNIDGKVNLLINPSDRWSMEAKFTTRTDGGAYVLTIPYGIKFIETLALEKGKGIAFVGDRYDAFTASSAIIEEFDQTFALEDWMLYTTKAYFYGKAKDNHAAALVTLVEG